MGTVDSRRPDKHTVNYSTGAMINARCHADRHDVSLHQ